jgi:FkbM family methyltransferase
MRFLLKRLLDLFGWIITRNQEMLKYFLSKSIHNELRHYNDYVQVASYPHILKTLDLLTKANQQELVIADIGGADGKTAEMFASAFPHYQVLVFEPLSSNQEKLEALAAIYPNITIIQKALGAVEEEKEIYITNRITSSSLLRPLQSDQIQSDLMKDAAAAAGSEIVHVSTLNNQLREVRCSIVLKIDVQGFELNVLKGASDVLNRVLMVVVEVSNHDVYEDSPAYHDIDAFMRASGFIILDMSLSFREKSVLREWDVIYFKKEKLQLLD